MGVQLSPHLFRLMSPEDRKRYGMGILAIDPPPDSPPPSKSDSKPDVLEREEQRQFAAWLLLQNSKGRRIPFCWHVTHTRSKATPGTPDFWLGITGRSIWIEFKRDNSCRLTPEQEDFRLACQAQHIEHCVVYSALEAIQLVQAAIK